MVLDSWDGGQIGAAPASDVMTSRGEVLVCARDEMARPLSRSSPLKRLRQGLLQWLFEVAARRPP